MKLNWKIALPIGIVVIAAAVVLYSQLGTKTPPYAENQVPTSAESQKEAEQIPLPAATGNVDDVINALLTASNNEQSTLQGEDSSAALISADSQTISDFGQSYNEKEF